MHAERLRASSPDDPDRLEAVTSTEGSLDRRGATLLAFADAVNAGLADPTTRARDQLVAETDGPTMVDAAAVIAAFEGFNRVADATGCRLGDHEAATADVRRQLDLKPLAGRRRP